MSIAYSIEFPHVAPIARSAHPIHFDSVLLGIFHQRRLDLPTSIAKVREILQTRGEGEDEVFCASAVRFDPVVAYEVPWARRTDVAEMVRMEERGLFTRKLCDISTGSGRMRNYFDMTPALAVRKAKAWVVLRNEESLEDLKQLLLSEDATIGRLRRLGYGRIQHRKDAPLVFGNLKPTSESWMRRILPFEVPGGVKMYGTTSPPYYDRRRYRECWMHPALLEGCWG